MIRRKYANMRIYEDNIDFADVENTITYSLSAKNLENNLNKREEELCNKIADLEAKLAERDKVILILEKQNKALSEEEDLLTEKLKELGVDCIEDLGKLQNQKALEQLDKVKEKFGYKHNSQLVISSKRLVEFIDNQIEELKKEMK